MKHSVVRHNMPLERGELVGRWGRRAQEVRMFMCTNKFNCVGQVHARIPCLSVIH